MYFNDPLEAEYLAAGGKAGFRLINPIVEHPAQMPGQEVVVPPEDVSSGNIIKPRPLPAYNPTLPPGAPGPSIDHTTDPDSILDGSVGSVGGIPGSIAHGNINYGNPTMDFGAGFQTPTSPVDMNAPPSTNNVYESPHIPTGIINDGMMAGSPSPDIEVGNPHGSVRHAPTMMFSTGGKVQGK